MRSYEKLPAGILEITDIPRRYVEDSQKLTPDKANMHNLRMDRFLGTVLCSKVPFGFRISTNDMSYGEIGEKLFDKYGYTLDARNIRKLILRDKRIKEE